MSNYYGDYWKKEDDAKTMGALFGGLILIILFIIFESYLYYWLGYFTGWLAAKTIGGPLVEALNMTFNTNIEISMLPRIAAALSWVGCFFKSFKPFPKTDNKNK